MEAAVAVGLIAVVAVDLLKEAGPGAWRDNLDTISIFDAVARAGQKWKAKARRREAHEKFRARPEIRSKRAEVARRWREHNHARRLAQPWLQRRAEARDAHYHRAFVAIDSEGMNYAGNDVAYNGVGYPDHRTFLWGAAGVMRITEPSAKNPHGEFWDLPLHWLGHDDKRGLTLVEILDWLTDLPEKYGAVNFISFGFNYDVTMILQAVADYMPRLAYRKVYEICKKERLGSSGAIKVKGHVFVGDYAIDWMKGKRLVVKKFRDPSNPKAGFIRRVTVYDVFGFYQSSFVKVMKSLEKLGLATGEEVATIERDKARRQNFDQVPLGEIKTYTDLELRKLSLAAIKLRDGFDYMKIRLGSWSGAGAAAAALIRARGVSKHYAGWVNKRDPSPEQMIAHAAYYGGHIELLKQGYSEAGAFVYDIKSAYPAEMQDLPSMIGGPRPPLEHQRQSNRPRLARSRSVKQNLRVFHPLAFAAVLCGQGERRSSRRPLLSIALPAQGRRHFVLLGRVRLVHARRGDCSQAMVGKIRRAWSAGRGGGRPAMRHRAGGGEKDRPLPWVRSACRAAPRTTGSIS